jgi:DNA-binding HxlR family transcriptional regulator
MTVACWYRITKQDEFDTVSMKIDTMDPASMRDPKAVRRELRTALATITGKWKLEILWLLNERVHRFGELRRAIPEVTQHMLTAQLRELEADGLVSRKVFAEVPPRVEYAITHRARALKPVFEPIFVWSRERHAQIGRR